MGDNEIQEKIVGLLFETGALRVAPEDKPFWYTAGTIGPYYSNTHFLFGGERKANELLGLIDAGRGDKLGLPGRVSERVAEAYRGDRLFRAASECIADYVRAHIDISAIDIISGGERRDWIFSFVAAHIFQKPHLTIFKDRAMVAGGAYVRPGSLSGMRCMHVSDLITEASSYARAWAPALAEAGSRISVSLTVVDRRQGGGEALRSLGIEHHAVAAITSGLFDRALAMSYINERQHALILRYIADPLGAMRSFLAERPQFVSDALKAGGKDAERARLCLEKGIYG
jgi:orotate phosphoribosyltransferase